MPSTLLKPFFAAGLAGLLGLGLAAAQAAEPGPAARVIVQFKAGSALARVEPLVAAADPAPARAEALARRTGLALRAGASVGERGQVVMADGLSSEALAARLGAMAEVEWAVVDRRRRAYAVPNDPLYLAGGLTGPASGQWYLRPPSAETPSGIDAERAWDTSLGSSSIVVAVLDSGVRFDHADMLPVGQGGNLLAGYDFINDLNTANDGDGRDADASDPGDWITADENAQSGGPYKDCGVSNSSWHGTEVAALVAATTNNRFGMAGVGPNLQLLPVRVLGKCGGFDSDILAGMRWAAGLPVPGVPINTRPARVINMSLGGAGACSSAYINTVAEINAIGVVIVASAGNSAGQAVAEPANCPGVIGIAGLRHVGTKVGFSDIGPEIALSAPGGNCVDIAAGSACRYPILTARNAGTREPIPGSSVFSDAFRFTVGTSFAAPLVSGAAGLMLSVQPNLTPAQVRSLLQQTTRPFPTTGGDNGDGTVVAQCLPPQFDGNGRPVDQLQCYCTTSTCGAGMLDAAAAVRAAAATLPPPVTTPVPVPTLPPVVDSGGGGGGGALGAPWLLALAAAVLALRGRRPRQGD